MFTFFSHSCFARNSNGNANVGTGILVNANNFFEILLKLFPYRNDQSNSISLSPLRAALQSPHVWEIVCGKNLTIFKRLTLFSILYNDFLKFSENRDKEFKLVPRYFNFPRTGNYIISCEIEAATRGLKILTFLYRKQPFILKQQGIINFFINLIRYW